MTACVQRTPTPTNWARALRHSAPRRPIGSPANPYAEFADDDDYTSTVVNPRASLASLSMLQATQPAQPLDAQELWCPQEDGIEPQPSRPARLSLGYACATIKRHLVTAVAKRRHSSANDPHSSPASPNTSSEDIPAKVELYAKPVPTAQRSPRQETAPPLPPRMGRRASLQEDYSSERMASRVSTSASFHTLSSQLPSVHISRLSQPKSAMIQPTLANPVANREARPTTSTLQSDPADVSTRIIDASYVKINTAAHDCRYGSRFHVRFVDDEPHETFVSPRASIVALDCY